MTKDTDAVDAAMEAYDTMRNIAGYDASTARTCEWVGTRYEWGWLYDTQCKATELYEATHFCSNCGGRVAIQEAE